MHGYGWLLSHALVLSVFPSEKALFHSTARLPFTSHHVTTAINAIISSSIFISHVSAGRSLFQNSPLHWKLQRNAFTDCEQLDKFTTVASTRLVDTAVCTPSQPSVSTLVGARQTLCTGCRCDVVAEITVSTQREFGMSSELFTSAAVPQRQRRVM